MSLLRHPVEPLGPPEAEVEDLGYVVVSTGSLVPPEPGLVLGTWGAHTEPPSPGH